MTDVFLRDRKLDTTERVSVGADGAQANDRSSGGGILAGGRFVVFTSFASNLVANDTNGVEDVFIRDRKLGTTERVSLGVKGTQGNFGSSGGGSTPDGRFIAFTSFATNLVKGDTNRKDDVFIRCRFAPCR